MENQYSYNPILCGKNLQWFRRLLINPLLLSTLTLSCFHQNAMAETHYSNISSRLNSSISNKSPVDFSLSFEGTDLELASNNTTYPIILRRVSAKIFSKYPPDINIGLILGSSFISQNNDATTAGLSMNGSHIGFAVNGVFGKELQLGLHASYIYQETRGENTLRVASFIWHEWLAEATLRLRLDTHWAVLAGGGLMRVDADRRVSGDINETIRMKLTDDTQGKIAIEMLTAPADRIRLSLNRGAFDGFQLTFAHTF